MIYITIAEAHNRLSALLRKAQNNPVVLTRRGKPVGVLISPEEYDRLRQFEAFYQVVQLSQTVRESNLSAAELYRLSRQELENEHDH